MKKMEKMTDLHGRLLEGCIWDECSEKLYFVDIECRKIYCFRPDCESLNQMELPDYVSDLVLKKDGTLIAALPDGLYHVDFDKRTADRYNNMRLARANLYLKRKVSKC